MAQSHSKGRFVNSTIHNVVIPEEGSLDEALRLTSTWAERVLKQHPDMVDVRYLLSAVEADTMQLMVLYTYETKAAADSAGGAVRRLIESEWPDPEVRQAFFDSLGVYINPALNVRASYWEIETAPN